jgi:hypothetical protein
MRSLLVLVHSPLVGALTWQPVADELRTRRFEAVVPSLADGLVAGPPYHRAFADTVAASLAGLPRDGAVVLVAHSGAGALLPAITEAVDRPVTGAVFVDAILPASGSTWFDTAPAELGEHLRGLARDGVLPPWHEWFGPDALTDLLPDEDLRQRFAAGVPRLPLAYFEERAPEIADWPPPRCGYLQLSEAYDKETAEAGRRGWLVVREPADHLAMLTRPALVSDRLAQMLVVLGSSGN